VTVNKKNMRYIVSCSDPANHFIAVECIHKVRSKDPVFHLPSWRPGRYELGNFSRNVRNWQAFDEKGRILPFIKTGKDSWQVTSMDAESIHVRYEYHAAQLDAGACWADESQLYVNGVHCFLYERETMEEECFLEIRVPADYAVATSMMPDGRHSFIARNFHELVDAPFIASNTLQRKSYLVDSVNFHVWIQGECRPDWDRILEDFCKFTKEQINMMKGFSGTDYHFLIQVLPYRFYHGVEHTHSTVLALGPGYGLMDDALYEDLLGVASHELFHAWNVKTIRPSEMLPYDYSRENYSRLGYVYEGATTYYGDLFLLRSGVFSERQYFITLGEYLQKHFDNYGRHHYSVAESSFDTWLDGYVEGIPHRKTSIYTEGCLISFMLDVRIRMATSDEHSLDDVMRFLYHGYALRGLGYTEADYINTIERISGKSFSAFFADHVYGTQSYMEPLRECFSYLGLDLVMNDAPLYHECHYGLRGTQGNGSFNVTQIWPLSAAAKSGLAKGDEIISVNGFRVSGNFAEWMSYFGEQPVTLRIFRQGIMHEVVLKQNECRYFPRVSVEKQKTPENYARSSYQCWSNRGL
jgi:predicted metalloprotease with PDZ domain